MTMPNKILQKTIREIGLGRIRVLPPTAKTGILMPTTVRQIQTNATAAAIANTNTNASTNTNVNVSVAPSLYNLQVAPAPAPATSNRYLSTAPAPAEDDTPSAPTRPARKDPIIVTPNAAQRIKDILSSPNGSGALGIRLGVKRRGCNGLSYTLNYAFDQQPNEEVLEAHGVTVFIEPMALFSVVGTVMDWEETDMSSEFTFENPNSKGECGCGESFNV